MSQKIQRLHVQSPMMFGIITYHILRISSCESRIKMTEEHLNPLTPSEVYFLACSFFAVLNEADLQPTHTPSCQMSSVTQRPKI